MLNGKEYPGVIRNILSRNDRSISEINLQFPPLPPFHYYHTYYISITLRLIIFCIKTGPAEHLCLAGVCEKEYPGG